MKSRLLLLAIVAIGAAALYFGLARPHVSTIPREVRDPLADLRPAPPPPLEPPAVVIPPLPTFTLPPLPVPAAPSTRTDPVPPRPVVPIQNGATIDFSTGYPHVRVQGKDQDALDAALREIADVEKRTGFEAKKP